jgi:bacterioferritin-associated ferredoxin
MVICVCNALSERACREAACRPECRTTGCVYRLLGARVRCGRCVPHMRALHEAARAEGGGATVDAAAAR